MDVPQVSTCRPAGRSRNDSACPSPSASYTRSLSSQAPRLGGVPPRHTGSVVSARVRASVLPTEPAHYDEAARLYRRCRREGETVRRLIDCLIAAVAIGAGVPVLLRRVGPSRRTRHRPGDGPHAAERRSQGATEGVLPDATVPRLPARENQASCSLRQGYLVRFSSAATRGQGSARGTEDSTVDPFRRHPVPTGRRTRMR